MSTATLTWTDPVADVNGDPLTASQLSIQLFDSASATPTVPIGSVGGGVGTFVTGVLTPGVHTFTAVAVDSAGPSAPSNAVPLTVPVTIVVPASPTNLAATLNP